MKEGFGKKKKESDINKSVNIVFSFFYWVAMFFVEKKNHNS